MKAKRRVARIARHLFRLCLVSERLDAKRVHDVTQRLARSGRRGRLSMLSELRRLVRLDHERHAARVQSAAELTDEQCEQIHAALTRRYGPPLESTFMQNPALIGGLRIAVASDVYDGSIRARLASLEAAL